MTMESDVPFGRQADVSWLLTGLVERVPHARSALLLSADGLVKAEHGLEPSTADQLAALAAGLYSLARSAATLPQAPSATEPGAWETGGEVRQVVVQLAGALLSVCAAGQGACLAVLTGPDADPTILGYEMALMVRSVRPFLATPARQRAAR